MTTHFGFNYACPNCTTGYVPYDNISCPKCGHLEEERSDFLEKVALAAKYHKRAGWGMGRYTPMAYAIMSLGDHIALQIFRALDEIEDKQPEDIAVFLLDLYSEGTDEIPEEERWYPIHLAELVKKTKAILDKLETEQ